MNEQSDPTSIKPVPTESLKTEKQETNKPIKTETKTKYNKGRSNDTPDIQLSKTLSYILRHGASKEGLKIRSDGFINLNDLLARPKLKSFSIKDIERVVKENEKQRFAMISEIQSDGTQLKFIRANQGHSLKVKDLELQSIASPDEIPIVVHGTFSRFWPDIATQGLKPMTRTHIHFAKGLIGEEGVISGMRASCDTFIYLNVDMCFQDKILFFRSLNGVILTEGLPSSKSIPPEYFSKVVCKGVTVHPTTQTQSV